MNAVKRFFEVNRFTGMCILLFHSMDCSTIFLNVNIWSVQPTPGRNSACSFIIILLMASLSLIQMILQYILLGTDNSVIPRQLVHSVLSPFFGSLTMRPFNHSAGSTLLAHIMLNSSYSLSDISFVSAFNISALKYCQYPGALLFFRLLVALMISSLAGGSRFFSNVSSVSLIASFMSGVAEGIGLLRTSLKCSAHLSSCFSSKVILFPFLSLMMELPLLYFCNF